MLPKFDKTAQYLYTLNGFVFMKTRKEDLHTTKIQEITVRVHTFP